MNHFNITFLSLYFEKGWGCNKYNFSIYLPIPIRLTVHLWMLSFQPVTAPRASINVRLTERVSQSLLGATATQTALTNQTSSLAAVSSLSPNIINSINTLSSNSVIHKALEAQLTGCIFKLPPLPCGDLGNLVYPTLPVSFGQDIVSRWTFLSDVY